MDGDDIRAAYCTGIRLQTNQQLVLYWVGNNGKPTGDQDFSRVEPEMLRLLPSNPLIIVAVAGDFMPRLVLAGHMNSKADNDQCRVGSHLPFSVW
jgi:hypothetical protein